LTNQRPLLKKESATTKRCAGCVRSPCLEYRLAKRSASSPPPGACL